MNSRCLLAFSFLFLCAAAQAQEFERAIEDNSFLIEEAFNQEDHVVQHIATLDYDRETGDATAFFTQEWPVGSEIHQLSYSIPYLFIHGVPGSIGDIMLNYRYQLSGEEGWAFVAPRLSVILPTGNSSRGAGNGSPGLEFNLPLSKRLSNGFIMHFNAGATYITGAEGTTRQGESVRKALFSPFEGTSGIFLLHPDFNFMLEMLFRNEASLEEGELIHAPSMTISPGVRFAINLGNLQIVPGLAFPVRIGAFTPKTGLFGYLSFEHPF